MAAVRRSRRRDVMLELIRSTDCHPSADWLYQQLRDQFPDVSLGTIYRNLGQLMEEGSIRSAGVVHGHQRYDGNMEPHSHFVCNRCERMIDLPDCVPEDVTAPLGEKYGFTEQSCELHIYGICDACREKAETQNGTGKEE